MLYNYTRGRFLENRRESDKVRKNWHFIKSTVCWPERNVSLMCPGIVDLFTEVKSMVD